jgi:chromosomal replication initiation ATPase DnaA
MQERFLVSGKAGSGKTHLVLQKFLHYVKKHREDADIKEHFFSLLFHVFALIYGAKSYKLML